MKTFEQLLPAFLQKYNHYLLTHRPWLWETKVIPFAFLGLCFTILMTTYYSFLSVNDFPLQTLIICCCLISPILLFFWLKELSKHNSLRQYAQIGKHMIKEQFAAYFITSLLLLSPFVIAYPHWSTSQNTLYVTELYLGIALAISMLIYIVKHTGALSFALQVFVISSFIGVFAYFVYFAKSSNMEFPLIPLGFISPLIVLGISYLLSILFQGMQEMIEWSSLILFTACLIVPFISYVLSLFVLDLFLITKLFSFHATRFLAILIAFYIFITYTLPKSQQDLLLSISNPKN